MANIKIQDVFQRIQYTAASPSQSVFAVPFPFFNANDVLVYQDDTLLDQGTDPGDYEITGAGSPSGGTVTLVTAADEGTIITIQGALPIDRTSIYSPTISNLTGTDLNNDFNRDIVMLQQLNTTQKFLQLQYAPFAEVSQDLEVTRDRVLPILEPLQAWRMNEAGNAIEGLNTPSSGGLAPDDATYLLQTTNSELPNSQAMGSLASGFVVNTTTTGVQLSRILTGRTNQIDFTNPTGIGANPEAFIRDNPQMPGTAGMGIPAGTTAQRVVPTPPNINVRWNTDLEHLEFYNHATNEWAQIESSEDGPFLQLAGGTMSGTINMGGNPITNVEDPINTGDATNKGYVDDLVSEIAEGLTVKTAVLAASTANFDSTYDNGAAGVGATLTADANGAFELDGETGEEGKRYLFKNQGDAFENGVYILTVVGDGSTPAVLTRATDFDQPANIVAGSLVPVLNGTANAGTKWVQTEDVETVGTDDIEFILWMINVNRIVTTDTAQDITATKTFKAAQVIEGAADAVQFTIKAHSTQTANIAELKKEDGSNLVTLNNSGDMVVNGSLQVDDLKIDGNTISSQDLDGDINISPNGNGEINASTSKIKNVVDPTNNQDAATKKYVDDNSAGDNPTFETVTFDPSTGGIVGTTTNNNADAGVVGEVISASVASGSAISLTSTVPANVTSISLTAGDWDVFGQVAITGTASSLTRQRGGVSVTSATFPLASDTNGAESDQRATSGYPSIAGPNMSTGTARISLSATTTVYLVAQAGFSGGTSNAHGRIIARRRR